MLSSMDYVRHSLELHLFFARIMKEHSFFLEIGFTPRDINFSKRADEYKKGFCEILTEAVLLSNGVVSPQYLQSGQAITRYTLNAEEASSYYTGVQINTNLTQMESNLTGGASGNDGALVQKVSALNQRAMEWLTSLIEFKTLILKEVLSCNMFTVNYPLLLDHILREAKFYLTMVQRLQNQESMNLEQEAYEQESFWNQIMAEHSKFIRGLLDPTENDLIIMANNFGNEFDKLTAESKIAMDKMLPLSKVTEESLKATKDLRDFKAQGTQGILECKVRSIIIPLLADHTLREANHYLYLLGMYGK